MNPDMRDMTLVYESPAGSTLEFGPRSEYRWGDTDLWDSAWDYDVSNGAVAGIRREPRESRLTVYVDAPDEIAGAAARDRLEEVLDEGVAAGRPGLVRCGEWYTRCLCVARRKDSWWFDGRYLEAELTLLRPEPVWIREETFSFTPAAHADGRGQLDLPFDFPFDFSANPSTRVLRLDSPAPCAWRLTVYGPAEDPYVAIGANRYQVFAAVPPGGLLIADSREMSIVVRDVDGAEVDAFDARIRGGEGSGEDMWAPVEPGASNVAWDESFGWDVTVYRERG